MYPEGGDAGAGAAGPMPSFGGSRLGFRLEGLIPLVLIIIIAFFLAARFGVISESTPIIGPIAEFLSGAGEPARLLIIGGTSQELILLLDADMSDLVNYNTRGTEELSYRPDEILAQYDIVLLDQRSDATKEISRQLGEAIQDFYATGGKVIVVKDSGIRSPQSFDVIGWEANLGDVVPVRCDRTVDNKPSCTQGYIVWGVLWRQDHKHPIMKGIDKFPAEPQFDKVQFHTFKVNAVGNDIALIQDTTTKQWFPGIVEKSPSFVGKSIYFNYAPEKTPRIFANTLKYLK